MGPDGRELPKICSIRCDFLTLMFKSRLTDYVSRLRGAKLGELDRALSQALELTRTNP